MQTKLLLIVGPTAVGKTALSIELAKRLHGEIVSADSIQIYRGLDIGSAKPNEAERGGIPHHLMDVADVLNAKFSVAEYQQLAMSAIDEISARGKTPIVVGGTGLYINALTYPLQFTSIAANPEIREELHEREEIAPGTLYRRLTEIDPKRAACIHKNDLKRIVRALEIYEVSGQIPSLHGNDFQNEKALASPYDPLLIGLTMERSLLYARIHERVDQMMRGGLLQEVLSVSNLPASLPALQGLGYKQLLQHVRGECTLEEAIFNIKQETRHFAKRQWTWFLRDKRTLWYDVALNSNLLDMAIKIEAQWNAHLQQKDEEG